MSAIPKGNCVGRYVVLEPRGPGLFIAYDPELDRRVALKVLEAGDAEARGRVAREAQAGARLAHPNIVAVHDGGLHLGRAWLAMELFEGAPLDTWLAAGRRHWRDVQSVIVAAGRGLAAAHASGICHGALGADCVLVDASGRAKVLGFARLLAGGSVGSDADLAAFRELAARALAGAPRRVRRALSSPAPSLDGLLAALEHDPWRKPRRALSAVVLAGVVAALAAAAVTRLEHDPCSGAGVLPAGVWDDGVRAKLHRAFPAGAGRAAAVLASAERSLDAYARQWSAMAREACEDTRVRRRQGEGVLTLRLQCLDQRRAELGAAAALFTSGRPELLDAADRVIGTLGSVASCRDARALAAIAPLPADPAVRAQIEQLRERLTAARANLAMRMTGDTRGATELHALARELGWAPLEAEALQLRSREAEKVSPEARVGDLTEAAALAMASGHVRFQAEVALELAELLAWMSAERLAEARHWCDVARGAMAHLEPDPAVSWLLERTLTIIAFIDRTWAEVEQHARRAVEIAAVLGPDDWRTPVSLHMLATSLQGQGRATEAMKMYRQLLPAQERSVGADSPRVAATYQNMGEALMEQEAWDEGRTLLERSRDIQRAAGGAAASTAGSIVSLGDLERQAGHLDAAERAYREAADVLAASNWSADPLAAGAREGLALVTAARGDIPRALAELERCVVLREGIEGKDHPSVAVPLVAIGRLQLARSGAAPAAERALRRALELLDGGKGDPALRAEAQLLLARAREAAGDRAEAIDQASRARAWYAAVGRTRSEAEVAAWLQAHPP